MNRIIMGRAGDPQVEASALMGMFRLRDTVFHKRLGWDVESRNGLEIDRYDELDPVYMLAHADGAEVDGCWRLLPTTGPYMLVDTFPQLLRGETAPRAPHIWELSRFAVTPTSADDRRQVNFSLLTFEMMQTVVDHAMHNGIQSYVTVTSAALERMLVRAGIPLRRFGDGQLTRVGKVQAVACWISIDEQCRDAVYTGVEMLRGDRRAA